MLELNKPVYAAVKDGCILGHPEGYMVAEEERFVRNEVRVWKEVIGVKEEDVEIKRVKIVEVSDDG